MCAGEGLWGAGAGHRCTRGSQGPGTRGSRCRPPCAGCVNGGKCNPHHTGCGSRLVWPRPEAGKLLQLSEWWLPCPHAGGGLSLAPGGPGSLLDLQEESPRPVSCSECGPGTLCPRNRWDSFKMLILSQPPNGWVL